MCSQPWLSPGLLLCSSYRLAAVQLIKACCCATHASWVPTKSCVVCVCKGLHLRVQGTVDCKRDCRHNVIVVAGREELATHSEVVQQQLHQLRQPSIPCTWACQHSLGVCTDIMCHLHIQTHWLSYAHALYCSQAGCTPPSYTPHPVTLVKLHTFHCRTQVLMSCTTQPCSNQICQPHSHLNARVPHAAGGWQPCGSHSNPLPGKVKGRPQRPAAQASLSAALRARLRSHQSRTVLPGRGGGSHSRGGKKLSADATALCCAPMTSLGAVASALRHWCRSRGPWQEGLKECAVMRLAYQCTCMHDLPHQGQHKVPMPVYQSLVSKPSSQTVPSSVCCNDADVHRSAYSEQPFMGGEARPSGCAIAASQALPVIA
jgi:hypothetical protein